MSMRLQEVHPSLVHYPLALLPTSLAADALGRLTGSRALLQLGRQTMPLAAGSALVAGVFGLVAQETVRTDEHTRELLVQHRNLNLGLIGLTAALAVKRMRSRKPSRGYLALGAGGIAAMFYSAYLGGHMVYEHGLGVSKAGGLREEQAPKLTPEQAGEVARKTVEHVRSGVRHTLQDLAAGGGSKDLTTSQSGEAPAVTASPA